MYRAWSKIDRGGARICRCPDFGWTVPKLKGAEPGFEGTGKGLGWTGPDFIAAVPGFDGISPEKKGRGQDFEGKLQDLMGLV